MLVPNWLGLLPIKNDVEEAKVQNEFVVQLLQESPQLILGEQFQRFEQIVLILAEISNKKYLSETTVPKLATLLQGMAADANFGPQFQLIYQNKLTEEQKERLNQVLKATQ